MCIRSPGVSSPLSSTLVTLCFAASGLLLWGRKRVFLSLVHGGLPRIQIQSSCVIGLSFILLRVPSFLPLYVWIDPGVTRMSSLRPRLLIPSCLAHKYNQRSVTPAPCTAGRLLPFSRRFRPLLLRCAFGSTPYTCTRTWRKTWRLKGRDSKRPRFVTSWLLRLSRHF